MSSRRKSLADLVGMLEASERAVETSKETHEKEMKNLMDDISQSTDSEIYTPEGKSKLPASALKVFERKLRDAFAEEKAAALKEYASNFENTKQDAVDAAVLKIKDTYESKFAFIKDDLRAARKDLLETNIKNNQMEHVLEANRILKEKIDELRDENFARSRAHGELAAEMMSRDDKHKVIVQEALRRLTIEKEHEKRDAMCALREEANGHIQEAVNNQHLAEASVELMKIQYAKERKLRIKLHNTLIDLQGNIRVLCRVRPVSASERELEDGLGAEVTDVLDDCNIAVTMDKHGKSRVQRFEFDQVFHSHSTQEEVFEVVQPLCISFLDGFNICIFAYGQTGSGKTFTMEGDGTGVSPRCILELFALQEERRDEFRYELILSMMQIHNDCIYDLLGNLDTKLSVRQTDSANGKFEVIDATEVVLSNAEHALALIRRGMKNRAVASHNLNQDSSRSHAIITMKMTGINIVDGKHCSPAKLHLVDLAGSERLSKTMAVGDQLVEANNINKSLLALGDVVNALATKASHVPYRNSKLTFLLQDSLSGSSKVFTFVNISPTLYNASETVFSLKFAARCRLTETGNNRPSQPNSGTHTPAGFGSGTHTPAAGMSLNLTDSIFSLASAAIRSAPGSVSVTRAQSPAGSVSSRESSNNNLKLPPRMARSPSHKSTRSMSMTPMTIAISSEFPTFSANPSPMSSGNPSRVSSRKASPLSSANSRSNSATRAPSGVSIV